MNGGGRDRFKLAREPCINQTPASWTFNFCFHISNRSLTLPHTLAQLNRQRPRMVAFGRKNEPHSN
jgi:hypothetical protein